MEFTLNIFTLNCWGIPVISKNRKERFEAIAQYLVTSKHNIVCLQEVWSERDYHYLKDELKNVLSYSHYFYSGVLGSGLCIFSKWQIQDVFFHQWPLNGYIHKIHHGDWFGGKGVGLCRVKYEDKLINVYCTHLHAEYHKNDMYLAHRVLQAYSTAEFVNLTKSPADLSVVVGDLNTGPGDISYRIITEIPLLLDPYDVECNGTDISVGKASGTCENANNSYTGTKQAKNDPDGKRIDHILYFAKPNLQVSVKNFGNPLPSRVPGQKFSYSDHNAVMLELHVCKSVTAVSLQTNDSELDCNSKIDLSIVAKTITEAIQVCEDAQIKLIRAKRLFLTCGGLLFMLILGSFNFWQHNIVRDIMKVLLTALCLYYFIMGTIWNRIEMNSLKAGLSGLRNMKACNDTEGPKND